jgi:hypothetical protein
VYLRTSQTYTFMSDYDNLPLNDLLECDRVCEWKAWRGCDVRETVHSCRHRVLGPTRMARQSSSFSLSSPPSSSTELQPPSKAIPQLSPFSSSRTPTSPRLLRNASSFAPSRHPHASAVETPDDLFTKLTISEVKQVHQRLLCAIPLHICLRRFTLTLSRVR